MTFPISLKINLMGQGMNSERYKMVSAITHYVPDTVLCVGDTVLDREGRLTLLAVV